MKDEERSPFRPGMEFTLRLRVLKGDVPGVLRVRKALKMLLRAYGLRNEGIDVVKESSKTAFPGE